MQQSGREDESDSTSESSTGYGLGDAKGPGTPVLIAAVQSSSLRVLNVSAFLDRAEYSRQNVAIEVCARIGWSYQQFASNVRVLRTSYELDVRYGN